MHVHIAHETFEPLAYECARRNRTLLPTKHCESGSENELLALILPMCNISYTLHSIDSSDLGGYINGSFTKTLGMVVNGTYDLMNTQWTVTGRRHKFFNFGFLSNQLHVAMVVKKSKVVSHLQAAGRVFAGFHPDLYLGYAVFTLVLVALLSVINQLFFKSRFTFIFATYKQQDLVSRKLAVLLFAAIAVIAMNLYQNVLLTQLFKPQKPPAFTFDTLVEKLERKQLKMIVIYKGGFFQENIWHSDEKNYRRLRDALRDNPLYVEKNITRALDLVQTGNYVIRTTVGMGHFLTKGRCGYDLVEMEGFSAFWKSYIVSKRSAIDLPEFIRCHIAVAGFQEQKDRQFQNHYAALEATNCDGEMRRYFEVDPLSVNNLLGCFALLFAGSLIAVGVLFCEIQAQHVNRNQTKKPLFAPQCDKNVDECAAIMEAISNAVNGLSLHWLKCEIRCRETDCSECGGRVFVVASMREAQK